MGFWIFNSSRKKDQIADISMTDCVLFMVDEPQAYFRLRVIIINTIVTEWNKGKMD